jgi:protoporphyrinogen oxidase
MKCGKGGYKVVGIDGDRKVVKLESGEELPYDTLISTMAIDDLLNMTTGKFVDRAAFDAVGQNMQFSSTNVIGFGIKGAPPAHLKTMCWMYFPEGTSPFYRVTVFSNYSPNHAPEGHWSLMLEVSESNYKPVNQETLIAECLAGCKASQLLTDADEVVSTWHHRLYKGYPTPFVGRNDLLAQVQPILEANGILSRGRFGGWKYEVGNQDHSMMQGVEAVERALGRGCPEGEPVEATYHFPDRVNASKNMVRRLGLPIPPQIPVPQSNKA